MIWNNSFLCDGYDSLCHCLTNRHGLTTIHWSSHDEATTFQTGSLFHFRKLVNNQVQERTVQVAKNDSKWEFFEIGEPLAVEDQQSYTARLKRDRLNEEKMTKLLEAVGASPWQEDFYVVNKKPVYVIRRMNPPNTVIKRQRREVIHD